MASTEALRLAAVPIFDRSITWQSQATIELRRLSAENEAFGIHLSERMKDLARVEAQRDALLEALKLIVQWDEAGLTLLDHHIERARAAIKAVEEGA